MALNFLRLLGRRWGSLPHSTEGIRSQGRDGGVGYPELRAAVEMLSQIPPSMHVVGTMDSAYVKKGITEWLPE
jgi:hypothetical protein